MALILSFAAFGCIAFLAAVSPGPDFLVVTKNSLGFSRKVGIATALGVGCGIFVHVAYTVIGIGLVISKSILLFSAIKLLGALYLIYLGTRLLFEKNGATPELEVSADLGEKGLGQAFREGFFTNALNPKATVFFVSVFSQVVSPKLPIALQSLYGVEAALIVFAWFAARALMLTHARIKQAVGRFQARVLKIMGAALILLGIKVAFSR